MFRKSYHFDEILEKTPSSMREIELRETTARCMAATLEDLRNGFVQTNAKLMQAIYTPEIRHAAYVTLVKNPALVTLKNLPNIDLDTLYNASYKVISTSDLF